MIKGRKKKRKQSRTEEEKKAKTLRTEERKKKRDSEYAKVKEKYKGISNKHYNQNRYLFGWNWMFSKIHLIIYIIVISYLYFLVTVWSVDILYEDKTGQRAKQDKIRWFWRYFDS